MNYVLFEEKKTTHAILSLASSDHNPSTQTEKPAFFGAGSVHVHWDVPPLYSQPLIGILVPPIGTLFRTDSIGG